MNLQTGDVLHCTRNKIISRIIRRFTKSDFSHSALFISIDGSPFIMDAQKDGVNIRPFNAWMKRYKYQFIISRKDGWSENIENVKLFVRNAMSKSGVTPYDFRGLILEQPFKILFKRRIYRIGYDDKRLYCSEFVAWAWGATNYQLSPQDLYNWCTENRFVELKYEA